MNSLLNIFNYLLSEKRGAETGIVGLFLGIGLAILIAWQWPNILPFLDFIGIVDFFERRGLINENEPYITAFNIFLLAVKIIVVLYIGLIILVPIFFLLMIIFSNEKVSFVTAFLLGILIAPFLLIFMVMRFLFSRRIREEYRIMKAAAEERRKRGTALQQLLRDDSVEITREEALIRLNRLPTEGDDLYLLGLSNDDIPYILTPKPLNVELIIKYGEESEYFSLLDGPHYEDYDKNEVLAVKFSVEIYNELMHKPKSQFAVAPIKYHIVPNIKERVKLSLDNIKKFYLTEHKDMKRIFRRVLSVLETEGFIKKIQDCYFSFKNAALKGVQEAIEANNKKEFNRWHQRLKCFNASNDEIVQMMRKNERKLEDWEIEKMFSENISEWDKNGYDG
ncbi:hypothetical protein [Caldibacillus debilis]|uniref:Uncharacterized protein n=1 Tax=Caldibacillus debilis TaxID=301148 RepID=A0A150MFX0_9BACI|nr:hypothetical protein [Caldibacillus debilis]KYD23172.1 hypothetical protein B4135_0995 [Caldibacillus debilis]